MLWPGQITVVDRVLLEGRKSSFSSMSMSSSWLTAPFCTWRAGGGPAGKGDKIVIAIRSCADIVLQSKIAGAVSDDKFVSRESVSVYPAAQHIRTFKGPGAIIADLVLNLSRNWV